MAHQVLFGKKYGYINFDDERFIGAKADDLNDFLEVLDEIEPKAEYISKSRIFFTG